MSQRQRRRVKRSRRQARKSRQGSARGHSGLHLESLESRLLLDVAGLWDEMGWRSASGGGVTWDRADVSGEAQMALSPDGDPLVFWIEGAFNEYIDTPIPYEWEMSGEIYARQYAGEEMVWGDLLPGSGDQGLIGTGSQLEVVSSPTGDVYLTWLGTGAGEGAEGPIAVVRWDGQEFVGLGGIPVGVATDAADPSIAVNDRGEVFVSYTAMQPATGQREVVVQQYGYAYESLVSGPPEPTDLQWRELSNEAVGQFGEELYSGVSADDASSFSSALAVDETGRPIVAWVSEEFEGNIEIYVRRWDGDSWEELGEGSASDPDNDGLGGVSNNEGVSIQPDIAVAANGDVIVAWVDWANWEEYDTDGQAGVHVKVLEPGSTAWAEYQPGVSATGAGIAENVGWYYSPEIQLDSASQPYIVWQGFGYTGAGERYEANRDGDDVTESPIMGAYASYYDAGEFEILNMGPPEVLLGDASEEAAEALGEIYDAYGRATPLQMMCWMPTGLVGVNDELALAYMWRTAGESKSELFVERWDTSGEDWVQYGRGASSLGNDVFGWSEPVGSPLTYAPEDLTPEVEGEIWELLAALEEEGGDVQLGVLDRDGDVGTEPDVMYADGEHVYLYDRLTGAWSLIDPPQGYGSVYDLRGEPEPEFQVEGNPLLAYIDTDEDSGTYGEPFVYEWVGEGWSLLGEGPAGPLANAPGDVMADGMTELNAGISVQAGPDGTVFLTYLGYDAAGEPLSEKIHTRLWDGHTWEEAGPGTIHKGGILQAVYYGDYTGYDWNLSGNAPEEYDPTPEQGEPAARVRGTWYWWEETDLAAVYPDVENPTGFVSTAVVAADAGADPPTEGAGVTWTNVWAADGPAPATAGVEMTFDVPTTDDVGEEAVPPDFSEANMVGVLDQPFAVINNGHIVVEAMYAMDTINTPHADMSLYLVVDGDTDNKILIDAVAAGQEKGYSDLTTVSLDTQLLGLEQLEMGEHTVAFWVEVDVSALEDPPGEDEDDLTVATIQFDNISIYQRIVGTAPDGEEQLYEFEADEEGWTFVDVNPDPDLGAEVDGVWVDAAGADGSGALVVTLGNGTATADLQGRFEQDFEVTTAGRLELGMDYMLQVGSEIARHESATVTVTVENDADETVLELGSFSVLGLAGETNYNGMGPVAEAAWRPLSAYGVVDIWNTAGHEDGSELLYNELPEGTYTLVIDAYLSQAAATGVVGDDGYRTDGAVLFVDNVSLQVNPGYTDWEFVPANGNTGEDSRFSDFAEVARGFANSVVGPDPDETDAIPQGAYDFNGALHVHLDDEGSYSYLIEDVVQGELGLMVVGFRHYGPDGSDVTASVLVDGVAYDAEGETGPLDVAMDDGWWNGFDEAPVYSYTILEIPMIEPGTHTVSIQLDAGEGGGGDLWLDNVFVLASQQARPENPLAYLLPTGSQGQREFAVGVTLNSPEVWVYATPEQSPTLANMYPTGPVESFTRHFADGYYTGSVWQLDTDTAAWETYGTPLATNRTVDFTGLGIGYDMPMGEIFKVEDMAVGPRGLLWVAMQRATTDMVNSDQDTAGVLDRFDVHPFVVFNPMPYWTVGTTVLDVEVWRWESQHDPLSLLTEQWEDTGFVPFTAGHAYTDVQIASSGGQKVTVAYTARGTGGGAIGSRVERLEPDNVTWGVLNTESLQNNQDWGAAEYYDMVVRPDGFPVVALSFQSSLYFDGLREFRPDYELPDMLVTEVSGQPNDMVLEFGTTMAGRVDRGFTVTNVENEAADVGDLLIYDILIGGIGTLESSPFSLRESFDYPITLEEGEAEGFAVRFDPTGLEPGQYSAVLQLHTNDPDHETHPYGHFHEIVLVAEVAADRDLEMDPEFIDFDGLVIGATSPAEAIVLTNEGVADVTIGSWAFDNGANFNIARAFVQEWSDDDTLLTTEVATTNTASVADDIVLAPEAWLTLDVTFTAPEVGIFTDTLYVRSDDDDSPVMVVALTGSGETGAMLEVTEGDGEDDGVIDLGSVIMGADTPGTGTITLTNVGTTTLEVRDVFEASADPDIVITPDLDYPTDLLPGEFVLLTVSYYPSPLEPGEPLLAEEFTGSIVISTNDPENPTTQVTVTALAVPEVPILEVREDSGSSSDDRTLEFGTLYVGGLEEETVTLANIGGAPLTLKSFLFADPQSPYSVIPGNAAGTTGDIVLAPGEERELTVVLQADVVGVWVNELQILSDTGQDPDEAAGLTPVVASLIVRGTSIDPVVAITDTQGDANDQLVDFGSVSQGQASNEESITLTNAGTSPVVLTGWSLTDLDDVFTMKPAFSTPVTLGVDQSQTLTVQITPAALEAYGGTVTILTEDGQTLVVELAGEGATPAAASITDTETTTSHGYIDFTTSFGGPLVVQQDQATEAFTITNTGGSTLVLEGVSLNKSVFRMSLVGTDLTSLDPDDAGDDIFIAPGASQTVEVTFAPANRFEGLATVTVTTDNVAGTGQSLHYVTLAGQSVFGASSSQQQGQSVTVADSTGNQIKVRVTGGGYAVVVPENSDGGRSDIGLIQLVNTTSRSSLIVSAPVGCTVGQIVGGTVRNVNLRNVVVDGEGVQGSAVQLAALTGQFTIGGLTGGADVEIASVMSRGANVTLGMVGDGSDVVIGGPTRSLRMDGYGDGILSAETITRLMVGTGDFSGRLEVAEDVRSMVLRGSQVDGAFLVQGDIGRISANRATFTGALNAANVGRVMFAEVEGADIAVQGQMLNLMVRGDMTDSRVLAGYNLGSDGRLGGLGSAADTLLPHGHLGQVNVTGQVADSFVVASVAPDAHGNLLNPANTAYSGSIGRVRFGSAAAGDNVFGVAARSGIGRVQVGRQVLRPMEAQGDFMMVQM